MQTFVRIVTYQENWVLCSLCVCIKRNGLEYINYQIDQKLIRKFSQIRGYFWDEK